MSDVLMFSAIALLFGVALGMKLSEWASRPWRDSAQNTLDGLTKAVRSGRLSLTDANRICDGWPE